MASATIANQVFSHHRLGASSRSRSGTESTSGSSSRSVLLKRSGLFALPSQADVQSPRHGQKQPQFRPAVSAGLTFLDEPSTSIDMERLVAEAPSLLALSSDFDWQKSVSELRKEALGSLSARDERDIVLKQLGDVMDKWLHDAMLESVLQPAMVAGVQTPQEELRVRIRVEELRSQATLQAVEELAHGVDQNFDWETEVAELRRTLGRQQHLQYEQQLWQSWETAHAGMAEEANRLHDEAFKAQHLNKQPNVAVIPSESNEEFARVSSASDLNWWTLGVALAGIVGGRAKDAIAADVPIPEAIAEEVAKAAPTWVAPLVLAFPVASYFLFTVYREKVNPYAKVTDWMFGLVAMAIVGNIVLIKTIGVRLY